MGLEKGFRNKAGVTPDYTDITDVTFISNDEEETYTVSVKLGVYFNRNSYRDGDEPVDKKILQFEIPQDENIGELRAKVIELIKTNSDYADATEINRPRRRRRNRPDDRPGFPNPNPIPDPGNPV